MSRLVHIGSITPPGLLPEKKCSGACHIDHVQFSRHAGMLLRSHACDLRTSIICAANPNNQRKSPDFSRQNRGYPLGRSRQSNNEKESYDNTNFMSKNGPVSQPSSNPRYQATASPGQKEKEIVELFRKVQAQLRQRSAINKEERVAEPPQQGQGEKGSVDSLLKLLRKHSMNQEKKRSDEEYHVEQSERDNPLEEEQSSNFFEINSFPSEEDVDENETRVPSRRPASNFQRRSPVPRVKYQPVHSANESREPVPRLKFTGKKNDQKETSVAELEPQEPIFFDDNEEEFEDEESESSDVDEEEESELPGIDMDELEEAPEPLEEEAAAPSVLANSDLHSMKVMELRELAKYRRIKGYWRMKKVELIKLLVADNT